MRLIAGDRLLRAVCALTTLLSFWIWSLASVMPVGAQAIELPLGSAAGSREAQITLDGKQWTPLTSSSSPLYDGAIIRTGNGVASVLLKDGTQLEFQPRSVMGISGSRAAPVVKIAIGRVLLRLPASSKIVLVTPSVRYQSATHGMPKTSAPIRVAASNALSSDLLGEIVVNQQGGSRIGLQQGEILARPVNEPSLHIVKAARACLSRRSARATPPSERCSPRPFRLPGESKQRSHRPCLSPPFRSMISLEEAWGTARMMAHSWCPLALPVT